MSVTDCYRDARLDAAYPEHWPASVELMLRGGRRLTVTVDDASGEPANPVSDVDFRAKFAELASAVLPPGAVAELAERISGLDREPDLRRVGELLRG